MVHNHPSGDPTPSKADIDMTREIVEAAPNPAQGIVKFKEQKRKRWLKPEELPALARAIDAEPSLYVRAALWLYLLTGVRKTELVTAKWVHVDWERSTDV